MYVRLINKVISNINPTVIDDVFHRIYELGGGGVGGGIIYGCYEARRRSLLMVLNYHNPILAYICILNKYTELVMICKVTHNCYKK